MLLAARTAQSAGLVVDRSINAKRLFNRRAEEASELSIRAACRLRGSGGLFRWVPAPIPRVRTPAAAGGHGREGGVERSSGTHRARNLARTVTAGRGRCQAGRPLHA